VPGGLQREYQQKIRSTQALQKVFRAQELIASSRIQRARDGNTAAAPFAAAITRAVSAVAAHSDVKHPLTTHRDDTNKVAVLLVASDRGMAGSFTAGIIRANENLLEQLRAEGKDPQLYVAGRRAVSYYHYRNVPLAGEWVYGSDKPTPEVSDEISDRLLAAFMAPAEGVAPTPEQVKAGYTGVVGVSEVYVVYTQFENLVKQTATVVRMLPLEVVEGVKDPNYIEPLYEFEPSVEEVLDALLPRYVRARIRSFMLESAASEVASRQQAMHAATDNAANMISTYTRKANAARQNDITQELTEIVSGADGLAGG
jgi:F-type H+-transporting ATPase subunit gamma